jgi:formylglycine-generating enzyme required for sulfatase activity
MNKGNVWIIAALSLTTAALHAAVPVVTNVVAQQRSGTKLVDIHYGVFDADGDRLKIRVEVSDNGGNRYSVPAFSLTGDIGENISTGANKHIVWDAGVDWDGEYSDEMRVKVIAVDAQGLPGLKWGNEIPPGGFLMGQDGGAEGSGPCRHVNIPWSYWLSKYEIRNDEYCDYLNTAVVAGEAYREGTACVRAYGNVYTGVPPAAILINLGDLRDIRWNVNNFEVCEDRTNFPVRVTWYGAVAFAQHYGYDLPTEAEWEKAARGPDHDDEDEHQVYPWGDTLQGGYANYCGSGDPWDPGYLQEVGFRTVTPVGYYDGDQTPFGADMANAYGLYDITGNVFEWTRSTWTNSVETYPQQESLAERINQLTNPFSYRVARGGSWLSGSSGSSYEMGMYSEKLVCCGRLKKQRERDYGGSSVSGSLASCPDMGFRVIRRDLP